MKPHPPPATQAASVATLSFPVEGMSCAACVARVERALRSVEGVRDATVNLATERATVSVTGPGEPVKALADAVAAQGYKLVITAEPTASAAGRVDHGPDRTMERLRQDLLVSLPLSLAVMLLSMGGVLPAFSDVLPLTPLEAHLVAFAMTSAILLFPGWRFFLGFWRATRHGTADMNSLVAVGTAAAYLYSSVALFAPALVGLPGAPEELYFDTTVMIISLILVGRYLEARAKGRASEAIRKLMRLQPPMATVLRDGHATTVPVAAVVPGELLRLRPGERVPVDGTVRQGSTTVDESMLTGESLPVDKGPGSTLIGGTINQTGSVELQATAVGEQTILAQIVRMVEAAQASKAPVQRLADRIASVFVPAVMGVAAVTFAGWLLIADASLTEALVHSVAVLIIACPCALGLATPAAIMVGTGVGAEHGILIKNSESLERAGSLRTIVLDKTGTLTEGRLSVGTLRVVTGEPEDRFISVVAGIEQHSEHPLGRAVVEYAGARRITPAAASDVIADPGSGLRGIVDGRPVAIGTADYLKRQIGLTLPDRPDDQPGTTSIHVGIDGRYAGSLSLVDRIRPTSARVVNRLHDLGLSTVMLTGDDEETARTMAGEAGIPRFVARVLPQQKADAIAALQLEGRGVGMVGDGVNDAPALARADVGIALGTGTDIAMEAADLTLVRGDLSVLPDAIILSRRTLRTIRQNFFWAFAYNVVGIPLAALGFLNPMVAAAAMAFSSVSVVSNSLRLRRLMR